MTLQTGAIAWNNPNSGLTGSWDLKNGVFDKGSIFNDLTTSGNVRLRGSADFNSDGKKDLVFRDGSTGQIGIAYSNGTGFDKVALTDNPGTSWDIGGVGDLNGDGYNDIFFQSADGRGAVWYFNGVQRNAAIASSFVHDATGKEINFGSNTGWKAVGIGDFTGDHKGDVLWQNTKTGDVGFWEMDGDTLVSPKLMNLANVGISKEVLKNDWSIAGTGDFNDDGKTDILWQNTKTGFVGSWQMDGETFVSSKKIGDAPLGWEATSTRDTSVANPLAAYEGARQNVQLNFSVDVPLSTGEKAGIINLAGIVEGAIGGRTNLPANFTLKFDVSKDAVENVFDLLGGLN